MPAETPLLLLCVAATWALPGLGLLALPDGPTPHLTSYDLHTALAVEARLPNGTCHVGTATVEEVSRADDTDGPARGLLLDFGAVQQFPMGTTIWLVGLAPTFW